MTRHQSTRPRTNFESGASTNSATGPRPRGFSRGGGWSIFGCGALGRGAPVPEIMLTFEILIRLNLLKARRNGAITRRKSLKIQRQPRRNGAHPHGLPARIVANCRDTPLSVSLSPPVSQSPIREHHHETTAGGLRQLHAQLSVGLKPSPHHQVARAAAAAP